MVLSSLSKHIALFQKTHLWLVMVTIVILFGLASPVFADNLDNWHWRNPSPQGKIALGVTYGSTQ